MPELVIRFCLTTQSIVLAIVALLSAVALLIDKIKLFFQGGPDMNAKNLEHNNKKENKSSIFFIRVLFSILLFFFGVGTFIVQAQIPPNVKITNEAWKAYEKKDYQKAIEKANECIDAYYHMADQEQSDLEKSKEPVSSGGKVSKEEKEKIHSRGLLNDVATCWHIKGRSYEKLKNMEKAIEAYCNALKYSYALTYDPSWDGFWSPSKDARAKLRVLGGNCDKDNKTDKEIPKK